MIVVDASAIVAILTGEPEADALTEALGGASEIATSPLAVYEATLGLVAHPQAFRRGRRGETSWSSCVWRAIVVQPDRAGNRPCRARGLRSLRQGKRTSGAAQPWGLFRLRSGQGRRRFAPLQGRRFLEDRHRERVLSRRRSPFAQFDRRPCALHIPRPNVRRQSTPRRRPLKGIAFHESRDRRVARQGEDHQQISGQGLRRLRLVRPCEGSRGEGRLGRPGRRFRHALGGRREGRQAAQRHRRGGQKCRPSHPGDRPGPGRRGHLLAHPRDPEEQEAAQGQARRSRGVQRRDQGRGPGGHAQSARDRRGPRRRLPGASRARLSGRLQPVAGPVAKAARRTLGGARAVGRVAHRLRPGA